ncbi:MAG TPA: SemiSWEET transporter [Syntrophales bacterium]|nr:SemiSWEET transporter [Syntrophales bacterium]HPQ45494.1 SemiSWEET transporter [Syntrophales bacterium]
MFEFDTFTWIGLIAATCTTISFLPQAIKVITKKQTRDISLSMYVIFSFGVLCWLIYGILTKDIPIICANSITFALSFTILVLKIRYK